MGMNPFKLRDTKPPKLKRTAIFGKPGRPIGICSRCKRTFPTEELQKYKPTPDKVFWICMKCKFKRDIREKFSGRI